MEQKQDHQAHFLQVASDFKAKRVSLSLSQKQIIAHMRTVLGEEIKVQAIDVAKFEMNHNPQSVAKFLPLAKKWLEKLSTDEATNTGEKDEKTNTRSMDGKSIKTENENSFKEDTKAPIGKSNFERESMNKDQPNLDDKNKGLPNSDDINVEICMTETTLIEPECIDLEEEEDIDYRYFCLECEGS